MQINITNGTLTQIEETLVPSSGYKLPFSIITTGASNNYSSSTGVITMSSLISPIEIIAEGEQIIPNITLGNLPIKKVYFGTQEVSSLSFGDIEIWKAWPKGILVDFAEKALLTSDGKFMKPLIVDPVLENNDWDIIKQVALSGKTSSFWSVGDTKTDLGTDNITRTFRIVNIEQDGSIVFEEVGLESGAQWNKYTNLDGDDCYNDYYISDIRNIILPATFLKFSKNLQFVIATTNVKVATNGKNGNILTLTDKLFLEANKEIGYTNSSRSEENEILNTFSYWKTHTSEADHIKYNNINTAEAWWLRSPYANLYLNDGAFVKYVMGDGQSGTLNCDSTFCFAPCFRIGLDQTGGLGPYISIDPVLENNDWNIIKSVCEANVANIYWQLGDTKTDIGTDGYTRTFRIVDMNRLYGKHVVFEQVELEGTDGSGATGVKWDADNINDYSASDIKTTILNDVVTRYSNDLQQSLTNTTVKVAQNGTSKTVKNVSNKLFLAAEIEVFGSQVNSRNQEVNALTTYAYYVTHNQASDRIKYKGSDGSAEDWWLRSPTAGDSAYVCYIRSNGTTAPNNAKTSKRFAPCFAF